MCAGKGEGWQTHELYPDTLGGFPPPLMLPSHTFFSPYLCSVCLINRMWTCRSTQGPGRPGCGHCVALKHCWRRERQAHAGRLWYSS